MVTPTNAGTPDLPNPFEPEKEESESEVPAEIVSENLPIPEPEKELEDFDITLIDNPSDVETAATEVATEALQIETPDKPESPDPLEEADAPDVTEIEELEDEEMEPQTSEIEADAELNPPDLDLTDAQFEEAEEMEEEPADVTEIEDEEEEDLNLITNAISDDYVDPNGQGFKKLIEEILPFDDSMHILPIEKLDEATHFFDLEHKVLYTHKPIQQSDLDPFKYIFLQLDLTEDEIRSIRITLVPLSQWEAFIHKIKEYN